MKILVAVEVEAERIKLFDGDWYCGNECKFNDSSVYCSLFRKDMARRLSECIIARIGEEK